MERLTIKAPSGLIHFNFSFNDLGKTVFLTQEEAEAALEKLKGEEHE